jgi:hypothetical protein
MAPAVFPESGSVLDGDFRGQSLSDDPPDS